MRRIVAALCAAFLFGTAAVADTTEDPVARERAALSAALAKSSDAHADSDALAAEAKAVIDDPAFASLKQAEQHLAYLLQGAALFDAHKNAQAQAPLLRASAMADAGETDWDVLAQNSYVIGDFARAAAALTTIVEYWPADLDTYSDHAVFRIVSEARKLPSSPEATALMEALFTAHWKPKDKFANADDIWSALLRLRLEHGDLDGARKVAALLVDPWSVVKLRADKRFDAMTRTAGAPRLDVEKTVETALAAAKANAESMPEKLQGSTAQAELLMRLSRFGEALALIDAALKRDPKAFEDYDDQAGWAYDVQAGALFALGRDAEGLAAMEKGAAVKVNGRSDVSQAINLAEMYNDYGRPKDALAAVEAFGTSDTSPYGQMALLDARACAYFQLGDKAKLDEALAYMNAHAADGTQPFLNARLFTEDLDGAAKEIIARLGDPETRGAILAFLQDYAPLSHPSAREEAMHRSWLAIRARPDVAAAIADVGRIESYPIRSPAF